MHNSSISDRPSEGCASGKKDGFVRTRRLEVFDHILHQANPKIFSYFNTRKGKMILILLHAGTHMADVWKTWLIVGLRDAQVYQSPDCRVNDLQATNKRCPLVEKEGVASRPHSNTESEAVAHQKSLTKNKQTYNVNFSVTLMTFNQLNVCSQLKFILIWLAP